MAEPRLLAFRKLAGADDGAFDGLLQRHGTVEDGGGLFVADGFGGGGGEGGGMSNIQHGMSNVQV